MSFTSLSIGVSSTVASRFNTRGDKKDEGLIDETPQAKPVFVG
jgi:hypothetical protein